MNRRDFLSSSLVLPVASAAAFRLSLAFGEENDVSSIQRTGFPRRNPTQTPTENPRIRGLQCLRCKSLYPLTSGDSGTGCPDCLAQGYPVNVTFSYDPIGNSAFSRTGRGLTRYRDRLPLLDFPTLGEGDTPLLPLALLARKLGLTGLYLKDESRGPTGSHKDRTSGLVVARAAQLKRPGVVAASSGNGGHSLAAYAGSAGVRCTILTTKKISAPWKQAIEATGATLLIKETSEDRWKTMKELVEKEGWYPFTNYLSPPVGSNPFAVQGCKTVAYELIEQLGSKPADAIIVPTCRGDLLWGLYEGFAEAHEARRINQVPRLYAVEPFPRLERILAGEDYRTKFTQPQHSMASIGGTNSAYQALSAVKLSRGGACSITNQEALRARDELAANGLYLELSSAACLAGLYALVHDKTVRRGDRVVMIGTSHGYKALLHSA